MCSRGSEGNDIRPSEQQSEPARSGFVIFSSLSSNMNMWITLFYVLSLFLLSRGGNPSVKTFFCKPPGCAARVTDVLCDDEQVFSDNHMANCTGHPPPNTVCQHDGRAFISIDVKHVCDFEGKDGYITTQTCADSPTDCAFISTTASPTAKATQPNQVSVKHIMCGVGLKSLSFTS